MISTPARNDIVFFRGQILKWFRNNQRYYPWRKTKNPFKILIAEMMLQRTKADQVVPVYKCFFSIFKSPGDVSSASMHTINRILNPLGLKWRRKKFKKASLVLVNEFGGNVPRERHEILNIPGVGDYVAGIVLSIAFNKKEWVVDSNVVRVFRRYFGVNTSKEGRRDRHIIEMARTYAYNRNPGKANLAIIDFASVICSPRNPRCNKCILKSDCCFFKAKTQKKQALKLKHPAKTIPSRKS